MRQSSETSTSRFRSPFAGRRVSSISLGVVALLAIVGSGIGMQVASSATVKNPGKLECGTAAKPAKCAAKGPAVKLGKTFTVVFVDGHRRSGYQSSPANGHKVCFATKAPNKVTNTAPKCVLTNANGVATSTFSAKKKGKAAVTAAESLSGADEGTLTVNITVS